MSTFYRWRKLTPKQREELLGWRREQGHPWHRPPHRPAEGNRCYHMTAACYEHRPFVGKSYQRMEEYSGILLQTFVESAAKVHAWCVLPNHYHVLAETENLKQLCNALGRLNGRTSFQWNGEDGTRGRKTWCGVVDRLIRSDGHFWSTVNYVHHNPVKHGYVERWQDWPFSSAAQYLAEMGEKEAARIWREYPVLDYGKGWDEAEL